MPLCPVEEHQSWVKCNVEHWRPKGHNINSDIIPVLHCTKNWIYTNLLGANMVQKSANEGEIKSNDGKNCIC